MYLANKRLRSIPRRMDTHYSKAVHGISPLHLGCWLAVDRFLPYRAPESSDD